MNLVLVGMNHRTAPVEVRERLNIHESRLREAVADLVQREGILEGMILSTCNRVEVAVAAQDGIAPDPILREFLSEVQHCDLSDYEKYLYWRRQQDAVRHIFRVAASLDSMILGEPPTTRRYPIQKER